MIGDKRSEAAHSLQGERTSSGAHAGRRWRHATDGGWFSYAMKVLPDRTMTLACTYWGSDSGSRTFDILIDDRRVATQSLNRDRPGEFWRAEYEIPLEATRDKETVIVRFHARSANYAGGVFGCAMLRPEDE